MYFKLYIYVYWKKPALVVLVFFCTIKNQTIKKYSFVIHELFNINISTIVKNSSAEGIPKINLTDKIEMNQNLWLFNTLRFLVLLVFGNGNLVNYVLSRTRYCLEIFSIQPKHNCYFYVQNTLISKSSFQKQRVNKLINSRMIAYEILISTLPPTDATGCIFVFVIIHNKLFFL